MSPRSKNRLKGWIEAIALVLSIITWVIVIYQFISGKMSLNSTPTPVIQVALTSTPISFPTQTPTLLPTPTAISNTSVVPQSSFTPIDYHSGWTRFWWYVVGALSGLLWDTLIRKGEDLGVGLPIFAGMMLGGSILGPLSSLLIDSLRASYSFFISLGIECILDIITLAILYTWMSTQ